MTKAIILASGTGSRMKLNHNKVFAKINKKHVLFYTIKNFEDSLADEIIIASPKNEINKAAKIVKKYKFNKIAGIVAGGKTRMLSAENGLKAAAPKDNDIVLIQDGARPFTPPDLINKIIKAAKKYGSAVCGVQPKDTIQVIDEKNFSVQILNREKLIAIQTPVAAKWSILKKARKQAKEKKYLNKAGYEDSALLHELGQKVKIVASDYTNLKITTPEDLEIARAILSKSNFQN